MAVTLKIKRTNELAKLPYHGSEYAAGYDLYAATSYRIEIEPHKAVKIDTGLIMEIPVGYFGGIFPRSGIATKRGLRLSNCTGVVDSDYRGIVSVCLHNDTNEPQYIEPGERIAQLIILPYLPVEFEEVDELSETERGDGGFGHTGTH